MRVISTKVDGVDTYPAAAYNAMRDELENAVLSADFTLDPNAGPDTDLNMLGKSLSGYANAGATYQDSGAADAYVLSIATNLKSCGSLYDHMTVTFKASATNTGASTVNVSALGVKAIVRADGTALSAGDIVIGEYVTMIYDLASTEFQLHNTFRPDLIKNIQQVVKSDTTSTASATYVDITGITDTITPRYTTSKVKITADLKIGGDTASRQAMFRLVRGSTTIYVGDAASARTQVSSNMTIRANDELNTVYIEYVDSPATVASTTYHIEWLSTSGATAYLNRTGADGDASTTPRSSSTLTLEEQLQ